MNISIILCILSLVLIVLIQGVSLLILNYQQIRYKTKQLAEYTKMLAELSAAKQQIKSNDDWRKKYEIINKELHDLKIIRNTLEIDLLKVTAKLESTQLEATNKISKLINHEKYLNEQFENLANRIFEQNNRRLDEQNRQSLNALLIPLREQLDSFRRQMQDNFSQEANERHVLKHEIHNLRQLNVQMTQETINLTRALKGNNKIQGNWGEVILTNILEASGLRAGYEYKIQANIKTDASLCLKPDVIVHLPQDKNIIIDSKVTLIAYERYFNAEDDNIREIALKEHITSIRNHIYKLGLKSYQQLPNLSTLDYVLMFIPIESAFIIALNKQPELITEALNNNVILTSPTTLLVALRTITNLWRFERQNCNARQIAAQASKLYDKIRLFIDNISLIGHSLDRAQDNYNQAMQKLIYGRGNMLAQAEEFRLLGVEIKRGINHKLVELATAQDKMHYLRSENNETNTTSEENVLTI